MLLRSPAGSKLYIIHNGSPQLALSPSVNGAVRILRLPLSATTGAKEADV